MLKSLLTSAGVAALLLSPSVAIADSPEFSAISTSTTAAPTNPEFAEFAPNAQTNTDRIDYTAWSEAMGYLVYPMGRSLRQAPGVAQAGFGTKIIYGHKSRYRLEGNRVMFSFFNDDLRTLVSDYRTELEGLPDQIDITSLPRNEQLSYWFNLHNVTVMQVISQEWPVRQPRDIEIDGVPFDQAKILTVQGVKMSLHDIRHQIVFRHWSDPKVIYGFWRGDIGGPSIASDAYSGVNVSQVLERNAREFVNSLRGTQKRGDRLQVSAIYDEARPYFFTNWNTDMRAHVEAYAQEEVAEILAKTNSVEAVIYEADIADLAGGVREPTYATVSTTDRNGIGRAQSFRIPQGTARLLREQATKLDRARKEQRTGTVIFNPINLPGVENDGEVD
ncbi:hypothetical protein BPTFM16_02599 [Altererythrobacter insulae]|nr:hypothetical protein BPTFM16_02599 [Altererythrobacter insulae]